MADYSPTTIMVSMADLAEAFITHLMEHRYLGPGVPSTVGITESNRKNIFTMVFKKQYTRERGTWGTPPQTWSGS